MAFGSVLAGARKITLTTTDNKTVTIKGFFPKLALRIIGVPHIGLRVRARVVLSMLDIKSGAILDAGCGNGVYSLTLGLSDSIVYGVDSSDKAISQCRRMSEEMGADNVSFYKADILKLPFGDNSFDRIIFSETMEHIREDKKAIAELHRVLKPDGIMVMSVPGDIFINRQYMERVGHHRLYNMAKLQKLLGKKFEIISTAKRNRLLGQLAWLLNRKLFFSKMLTALTFPFLYFMTYIDFCGPAKELVVKARKM